MAAHPTDARIKCVGEEHLLEVARRHGRPLPDLAEAPLQDRRSAPASPEEQAKPRSAPEAELDHSAASIAAPSASLVDLIQRLSCLETKMVTLQEHLTQLALALLQERERTAEHRIAALELLIQPLVEGTYLQIRTSKGQSKSLLASRIRGLSLFRSNNGLGHACLL